MFSFTHCENAERVTLCNETLEFTIGNDKVLRMLKEFLNQTLVERNKFTFFERGDLILCCTSAQKKL